MLSHVLLQWYHMTEDDVHSSQDLLAQILQMQAHIFSPWVWSLRMHAQSEVMGGIAKNVILGITHMRVVAVVVDAYATGLVPYGHKHCGPKAASGFYSACCGVVFGNVCVYVQCTHSCIHVTHGHTDLQVHIHAHTHAHMYTACICICTECTDVSAKRGSTLTGNNGAGVLCHTCLE